MGLAAFNGPHLLILDEPTNHLDIDSRTALMEAINDYTGAVILVSHDRFLIEACADRLWIVGNGSVKPFDGDMDDYRQLVLSGELDPQKRSRQAAGRDRLAGSTNAAPLPSAGRRSRRLRKKLDALESADGEAHGASSARSMRRSPTAPPSRRIPAKATDLSRMRAEAAATLASVEEEWLALSSEIEEAGALAAALTEDSYRYCGVHSRSRRLALSSGRTDMFRTIGRPRC